MDKATYVFNKIAQDYPGTSTTGKSKEHTILDRTGRSNIRTTTGIYQVKTKAGNRYYKGVGSGRRPLKSRNNARFNATRKSTTNPADSTTTKQFKNWNGVK